MRSRTLRRYAALVILTSAVAMAGLALGSYAPKVAQAQPSCIRNTHLTVTFAVYSYLPELGTHGVASPNNCWNAERIAQQWQYVASNEDRRDGFPQNTPVHHSDPNVDRWYYDETAFSHTPAKGWPANYDLSRIRTASQGKS